MKNDLPDYDIGAIVSVPHERLKSQIFKYIEEIKANVEPIERNGKDGLYLGTAGTAYMFYHLSKIAAFTDQKRQLLQSALEYIQPSLKVCAEEVNLCDVPAFMLGNCGVYAVASAIYDALGNEKECVKFRQLYNDAASICKDMFFLQAGSDELFVGRAGYICGALWMAKQTGRPFKADDIHDVCKVIISSGRYYSNTMQSPTPLMYAYYNVEYIGAGHGICSILQMLLSVPGYLLANPNDAKDVQVTTNYVVTLQDHDGNFPASATVGDTRVQDNELVHWCHGAGGVVYLLAKAFLLWQDDKYLIACRRVAELIWQKGLLKKGPGLCHGIAGNGYVFLLMYRLTDEELYLHRAIQFSSFLENPSFKHNSRVPDNPYSLFEGTAGTVCFLGDLLEPKQAAFPFCDIF